MKTAGDHGRASMGCFARVPVGKSKMNGNFSNSKVYVSRF